MNDISGQTTQHPEPYIRTFARGVKKGLKSSEWQTMPETKGDAITKHRASKQPTKPPHKAHTRPAGQMHNSNNPNQNDTELQADQLVAQVPYAPGETYDFYADRLVARGEVFKYDEITGFGYLLTNSSFSINFVPISNSTSFSVNIASLKGKRSFGRTASGFMLFKTAKQNLVPLIYAETVKCIDALIAPIVFDRCMNSIAQQGSLEISGLYITDGVIHKKSAFGTKSLPIEDYAKTVIGKGRVHVIDQSGNIFHTCSLGNVNAPLIEPILDALAA